MKAIGYVRVSTEEQAQSGVSLDAQEERIRPFCQAKGWELTKVIRDEGHSAKDLYRPGIMQIVAGCKKKEFEVVVVLKLDRLTRSVKDLGFLVEDVFNKNNVAFSSLLDNFDTSSANGRMVMNILATIAQWERDIISERTRDAMQFMKRGLRLIGAVPFGFDLIEERLQPNLEQMDVLKRMIKLRQEGLSFKKISDRLNFGRVPSKAGGRWHPKTVMGAIRHIQSLPRDHWVIKQYFPKGVETNDKQKTRS